MIDDLDRDEGIELMGEREEKEKDIANDDQAEGRHAEIQAEIYHIDMDHATKVLSMHEEELTEVQEVVEVVTTAKSITEGVTAVSALVSAASTIIPAAKLNIPAATITAAPFKVTAASSRQRRGVPMKKKQQVEIDEAYARKLHEELNQDIDWDVAIEHVKQKAKKDPFIQRYQVMKKRPQTEAQARRNVIMYLKNTVGFRLDYFKGISYDDIRLIFKAKFNTNMEFLLKSKEQIEEEENRALESINETPGQKAAKRRRLNQEDKDVEEIKQHLEIVPDEDDDVYTEATPLARKVPVVDYQIIHLNNKPRYKIIRADETHQLYLSFITLLKNFDREDLESLWSIVKKRFSTSKPNNFSDEYLLTTLRTMFGRPNGANDNCDSPLLGVNTPRSDEDRLKLMELMIFLMKKGVCDEFGLNAAHLSKFLLSGKCDVTRLQALVDKKRIMITEEVVREILQLNDAEGVVCLPNEEIFAGLARMGYEKPSTKLTFYKAFFSTQWKFFIHTILHSLSAKRTSWNEFSSTMASALICLSSGQRFNFSKYIFESLTNIANLSKHTTRYIAPVLTQKVFANMRRARKGFSGVEKPLFETMLAVRDVAKDAEAQVPAQGDDVQDHAAEEVATNVISPIPTSPSPSSPVIPSLPPHQSLYPPQSQDAEGLSLLFQRVLNTCSALVLRVEGLENDKAAQPLEIVKLKARVKKLEKISKVKSSKLRRLKKVGTSQRVESSDDVENVFNQGRMIVDMDQDEGIELVINQEKDAEGEGRHADKQAEIYNIDLDHSSKVLSMQEDDTEVQEAVEVVTTTKLMTEVVLATATQVVAASTPIPAAKPKTLTITAAPAVSTRRRKGVVIRDSEEDLHSDTPAETPKEEINKEHEENYKNIDWNATLDHVQSKEPQYIKRYHGIKKKPQTESEARKNMISYLKNTEGYKMDLFKGKTYDEILPIFQARFDANMKFLFKSREEMEKEDEEIIKSINETPAQKAAYYIRIQRQIIGLKVTSSQEGKDCKITKRDYA
uniref:Glutamic acid-rich protein-like n=1 Tax=Tanacetum cinerariifolium TaxID=118510 RepID=A0A6L2L8W7_TANCI|nr:hypothetical protein [Tanacetum cinerariifolium]